MPSPRIDGSVGLRILFLSQLGQLGLPTVPPPSNLSKLKTVLLGELGQIGPPVFYPCSSPPSTLPHPIGELSRVLPLESFAVIGCGVIFSTIGMGQTYAQALGETVAPHPTLAPLPPADQTTVSFQPLDLPLNPVEPKGETEQRFSNIQPASPVSEEAAPQISPVSETPAPPTAVATRDTHPLASPSEYDSSPSTPVNETRPELSQQPPQRTTGTIVEPTRSASELPIRYSAQDLSPVQPRFKTLPRPSKPPPEAILSLEGSNHHSTQKHSALNEPPDSPREKDLNPKVSLPTSQSPPPFNAIQHDPSLHLLEQRISAIAEPPRSASERPIRYSAQDLHPHQPQSKTLPRPSKPAPEPTLSLQPLRVPVHPIPSSRQAPPPPPALVEVHTERTAWASQDSAPQYFPRHRATQRPRYQPSPQSYRHPISQTPSETPLLDQPISYSAQDLLPLNPNPNLLQLPTEPQDVEIDLNQPITLQQALDLAQRNNLTLQITELQRQLSREALRQSRALNFPTLTAIGQLNRTENATFNLNRPPININQATQADVQQRTLALLQTEQGTAQQTLDQNISDLQQLLQTNQDTRQNVTFNQQIAELNSGATTASTLDTIDTVAPLRPLPPFLLPQSQGLIAPTDTDDDTDEMTDSATSIARGTLSLTYNIFTSGFRSGTIGAAREQLRFSDLSLQVQLDQLRLDVTNDYYDLQQATALVTVAQDTVDSASANLRNAQALEQGGLATLFDVLQAEVQLAQARQDLTQAVNLRTIAQRQLAQRLNVAPTVNVTAANTAAIAGTWPLSLEATILLALQHRPELEQFLTQKKIAQYNRRAALSAIRPQIQFFANLDVIEQLDDDVFGAFGYSAGIQVSLNFSDGGAAKAAAAQENENIAIAETQFADTKNQLRFEVEQAYSTLQANYENIGTSLRSVDRARENLRLAQLRFQAGIGTQLDITNAQADLTQAEGNLVAAVITYNRALASLQRATSYQQPLLSSPIFPSRLRLVGLADGNSDLKALNFNDVAVSSRRQSW